MNLENVDSKKLKNTIKVVNIMVKIDKMEDGPMKLEAARRIDAQLNGALEVEKYARYFYSNHSGSDK